MLIATATTTLPRLLALGVLIACSGGSDKVTGDNNPPPPPAATVVMSGRIFTGSSGSPVPSALIAIGSASTTSGADGTYSLSGVRTGTGKLVVTANRYDSYEQDVIVPSSNFTRDVLIQRTERFNLPGLLAMYVPASVMTVRAVIIALGGPDTRGFVNGFRVGEPGSPPDPAAVAALNQLTGSLQAFDPQTHAIAPWSSYSGEKTANELVPLTTNRGSVAGVHSIKLKRRHRAYGVILTTSPLPGEVP